MVNACQLRGHSGPVVNQVIKLAEQDITLGRDLANDVVIADSEVSRVHARISWQNDRHIVRDLKSTNGTWINGRPALAASPLAFGDLLTLGKTSVFVYEAVPEAELDTTREEEGSEAEDPVTSTMAMPIPREVASEARLVTGSRSPRPVLQPEVDVAAGQALIPAQKESPGESFHQKYVAHLRAGDLEGLLGQYQPDATLLSIDRNATGASGIREFFQHYFGGPGRFTAAPTGKYVEGHDSILCETSIETAESAARVQDVFVFRDGKVTHHFTCTVGVISKLTR